MGDPEAADAMARVMLERQVLFQDAIRERQMAMQIAGSRDLFKWLASFYVVTTAGICAGYKCRRNPIYFAPLVPFTFLLGYVWDMSYGHKIRRMRVKATRIMDNEKKLLGLPKGIPKFEDIEAKRLAPPKPNCPV